MYLYYWYIVVGLIIVTTLFLGYINILLGVFFPIFVILNWSHINNHIVQCTMIGYAKKIAEEVDKTFRITKEKFPMLTGAELNVKMLDIYFGGDSSKLSEKTQSSILAKCLTINGFGYMLAMDFGLLKQFMVFRLIQFTRYLDDELVRLSYERPSKEVKEKVLKAMQIYTKDWAMWTRE